jgi:AcrR family transcriptional regulator
MSRRVATRRSPSPSPRRRGRPPLRPEEREVVRQRLLEATRAVFTRVGYHDLSVDLVVAEAGLSRPTFYKHFRNAEEPLDLVIQDVNDRLIASLFAAVAAHTDRMEAIEAGLEAWRQWGEHLGPMLRPLFTELHDPHSPVSRHRHRTLTLLSSLFGRLAQVLGRPAPNPILVDTLLNGLEYLGYRFHLETPRDAASWRESRAAMLRLALAMLGDETDWEQAPRLAEKLRVDLKPRRKAGA